MEQAIVDWLSQVSQSISISLFVLLGSIVEELIPPVPSPFVMTSAGALLKAQSANLARISFIVLFGSLIKTFTAWVWYFLGDKTEDIVTQSKAVKKQRKKFGFSHKKIERLGKKLSEGIGDEIAMFLLRAFPLIPTSLVSIAAGVIKLNKRSYLYTTFLGMVVRNIFYILVAFGLVGQLT